MYDGCSGVVYSQNARMPLPCGTHLCYVLDDCRPVPESYIAPLRSRGCLCLRIYRRRVIVSYHTGVIAGLRRAMSVPRYQNPPMLLQQGSLEVAVLVSPVYARLGQLRRTGQATGNKALLSLTLMCQALLVNVDCAINIIGALLTTTLLRIGT